MNITKKRFSLSSILLLFVLIAAMFATTGCQKQPWSTRTPYNVGIVGDYNNADLVCTGTVVQGEAGQFYCQTDTKYNVGIVGDSERADAECSGVLVVGQNGNYECWIP